MITVGHQLKLPAEAGAEIIWAAPFSAEWAVEEDGIIRRPAPTFLDCPFGPIDVQAGLTDRRDIYPQQHFCLRIPNAKLVGERAILVESCGQLITDSLHWNHSARIFETEDRRRFEAVQLAYVDGGFVETVPECDVINVDDDVVLLSSMEQDNYGAFILRTVSKLDTVRRLKLDKMKVFVRAARQWQIDILERFGVDKSNIIPYERDKVYRFRTLFVPDLPTSELFCDDSTSRFFDDFVSQLVVTDTRKYRPDRLYVSRITQGRIQPHHRRCVNEEELADSMKMRGFHIFEPESHPFEEQVRVFAAAKVVVGPSGAGMFNTVFCRPGTAIMSLEAMPTWAILHANLFSGRRHSYGMVLGGTDDADLTEQKRWTADVPTISGRVEAHLGSYTSGRCL